MRKDYVSTFDGTLASLSASTRLIYLLILKRKAHEDNKYCNKDQFFHSVENWSEASGYSIRTVQYALKELRDLEIIDWQERPGRSTLYTHKKYITIYTPKNKRTYCTPPLQNLHPTPAKSAPITTKDLTTKDLTTTDDSYFKSYNYMVRKFGKEVVDVAIENVRKLNGEVQDFWAYVHWSCKTGIAPTNKTSLQAELKEKHIKFIEDETEKRKIEQEENERIFAKSDPEGANKAMAEFISIIGVTEL